MAQTKRKPAAAKPAAKQDTAPEAGGTDAQKADVSTKPAEDPTPPDGDGQVIAQAPGGEVPAEPQANQPAEEGAPSPVSGSDTASAAAAVDQDWAGKAVRIRTHNRKPRRRAGRAFGDEPVEIAVDELSDADIAALLADPALAVELVTAS